MQFGVYIFPTDKTIQPIELAKQVEARGFESLWFPEHSHIPISRDTPWGGVDGADPLPEQYWRTHDQFVALAAAAAEGDRSENAEYIYRKKEIGGLDYRIRYLQKRLPSLNVVRESPNADAIYFGAYVEICDDDGEINNYRIVGADEADAKTSSISMDSPLAKSMMAVMGRAHIFRGVMQGL